MKRKPKKKPASAGACIRFGRGVCAACDQWHHRFTVSCASAVAHGAIASASALLLKHLMNWASASMARTEKNHGSSP